MYFNFEDIIDKVLIKRRAKSAWDELNPLEKLKNGKKYFHASDGVRPIDWLCPFDVLSEKQKNILIKGELIRTYDCLLLSDKKKLTNEACLSTFQTKWYKMSSIDKQKLLNHILHDD